MAEQRLGLQVGIGAINRTCPACGKNDPDINAPHETGSDPRHIGLGAAVEQQAATLADGTQVNVNVPVDHAYHLDCHASLGCEHCEDMLAENDGSLKGKVDNYNVPAHLHGVDITTHFDQGNAGILRRNETGHAHLKAVKNG